MAIWKAQRTVFEKPDDKPCCSAASSGYWIDVIGIYGPDGVTMITLQQAEQLLLEMSPTQKLQLLQLIAKDLGGVTPGIESTPGICGGDPLIEGTRIPVWVLVEFRSLGTSNADILRAYPTLRAEDLTNAWTYY